MGKSFLEIVAGALSVALIASVTRWILSVKGAQLPDIHGDCCSYSIKKQWRALGIVGIVFWVLLSVWSWRDEHHPDGVMITISIVFVVVGTWIGSGAISTDEMGITKTVLWHSRSFKWQDITEVRFHKNQGGTIELRSGASKLVIDSRIDALQHLLKEIENRTQLQTIVRH
jgi:hypothetical protein